MRADRVRGCDAIHGGCAEAKRGGDCEYRAGSGRFGVEAAIVLETAAAARGEVTPDAERLQVHHRYSA